MERKLQEVEDNYKRRQVGEFYEEIGKTRITQSGNMVTCKK